MRRISQKNSQLNRYKRNFDIDTGFEFKCTCCLQYKGVDSCYAVDKLTEEHQECYLLMEEITRSKDGLFYICIYCYQKVKRGNMENIKDKPIQLVKDIPNYMKQLLINNCQYKDIILSDKERFGDSRMCEKFIYPNRLEQHLLKRIIPFIRFGNCPRGPFMQVK